jgi:O-acetyl-ADP-ribose deacetylase (regulator of RNase III)
MIKYVSGDILLSDAQAIVHGVAPHDDFKQGLALSLRENWPSLYKDFRHFCKTKSPESGELWSWKGAGGPMIINLLTQNPPPSAQGHPGKATIQHVNHCLKNLLKEIKSQNIESLAMTRLATGVGGLDWEEVKPIVEQALNEIPETVYVYETFQKGQKAQEH